MKNNILEKNIRLLKDNDPLLASRIERCVPSAAWEVVMTSKGVPTLKYTDSDGKKVFVHSAYDPEREAEQLFKTYEYSPTADLIVLGFGFGYHVRKLLEHKGNHGFIFISERNLDVLRIAFEHIDLEDILSCSSIQWFVDDELASLFNRLTEHALSILANSVTVLNHPSSLRFDPEYYAQIHKCMSDVYAWAKVNANTQISKANSFAENTLANYVEIIKNPGIGTLFNKFKNVPAFIVSAGPSLDKNVHYLREVKDKGLIIAVDSAVMSLMYKNIVPDIIVSIDFSEYNTKYFDNFSGDNLVLAFDPEVHPSIPEKFKGRKFVISLPKKSLCEWFGGVIGEKGMITKGLSVSHTALQLAHALGADPIVFVGQDLSFPRGAWHTKGSSIFQKVDISQTVRERMIEVPGYFEGSVTSEVSLKVFIDHFSSMRRDLHNRCYNATEGGAALCGFENISLRDAITRFCTHRIDKSLIWDTEFDIDFDGDMQKMHAAGVRVIEKLTRCNHNAYSAYRNIEKMIIEINKTDCDNALVIDLYKKVLKAINEFSYDEEVLQVIKDNALEALIIRAKREMRSLDAGTIENKEELQYLLNKERSFFKTLVMASDFLSQKFCLAVNDINEKYLEKRCVG